MSTKIINITNAAQFAELTQDTDVPAVIDFWAPWCGPCRALGPILEETADSLSGQATIAKVNVDENPDLARQYGITSIPSILYFAEGELKQRQTGVVSKEVILANVSEWTTEKV